MGRKHPMIPNNKKNQPALTLMIRFIMTTLNNPTLDRAMQLDNRDMTQTYVTPSGVAVESQGKSLTRIVSGCSQNQREIFQLKT